MSANVFGSEISEETVRKLPEYNDSKKPITQEDLAKVALDMRNAGTKLELARAYLDGMKYMFGAFVCTRVLIYNATGGTMSFIRSYDWHGHVAESYDYEGHVVAPSFPKEIKNGQWGVFFHLKPAVLPIGSEGAVVYRLNGTPEVDCMLSWSTPYNSFFHNQCYAEIRAMDHFDDTVWGTVEEKMGTKPHNYVETSDFFKVTMTIGTGDGPECQATVALIPR